MKSSPFAAWLVCLLIAGLGMMGCGEADVPFSPEGSTTDPNRLTHVTTTIGSQANNPLAGVSIHGNYAYVGGLGEAVEGPAREGGVLIVDVSDPANPELVARIRLRYPGDADPNVGALHGGGPHEHGDAVATSLATAAFEGDVAIVLFGVPDDNNDPAPYGIWDVTDPRNPTLLSVLNLGGGPCHSNREETWATSPLTRRQRQETTSIHSTLTQPIKGIA